MICGVHWMIKATSTILPRLGFFTYPWDLVDEGADALIAHMVTDLKCNAIMLNAQYHHARLLRPQHPGEKTYQTSGAVAAFTPDPEQYQPGGLMPVVDDALAGSGVIAQARKSCMELGVDFGLWVVGLHNSSLGMENPDLCVKNCFGDVYTYALCPSREENQQYLQGLVGDVCSQFSPDRIALEAVGVLGLRHWVHHELFMTDWDPALELLTSICFCDACVAHASSESIDGLALRQEVAQWAGVLMNEERGALPKEFTAGEPASLLMEIDGLWAYLQACSQTVTAVVDGLHQITQQHNTVLEVIPASFHRPSSNAWLERASIKTLAKACDQILISSYFVTPAEVGADLRWSAYLASETGLTAGINACSPTSSAGVLEAQVNAALDVGCSGVYYYNYGLLTEKRVEWVGQVNRSILESLGSKNE